MHTLEKRGKAHYFSHVDDGSKRHVYLGSEHGSAVRRLAFLKSQRQRSCSHLYVEMEKISSHLDRIASFHRPPEEILLDIRRHHDREAHASRIIAAEADSAGNGFFALKVVGLALLVLVGVLAFFPQLAFTGHSVADVDNDWYGLSGWSGVWESLKSIHFSSVSAFVVSAVALSVIVALFFGRVEYRHRTRHDRYKHPLMRSGSKGK